MSGAIEETRMADYWYLFEIGGEYMGVYYTILSTFVYLKFFLINFP